MRLLRLKVGGDWGLGFRTRGFEVFDGYLWLLIACLLAKNNFYLSKPLSFVQDCLFFHFKDTDAAYKSQLLSIKRGLSCDAKDPGLTPNFATRNL